MMLDLIKKYQGACEKGDRLSRWGDQDIAMGVWGEAEEALGELYSLLSWHKPEDYDIEGLCLAETDNNTYHLLRFSEKRYVVVGSPLENTMPIELIKRVKHIEV